MAESISWRQRLGRGVLYAVFLLAVYLLALWHFLPYDKLARRAESALRHQNVAATLQGLGPDPLLGLRADTLTLAPLDRPQLQLQLEQPHLRPVFARLIRGEQTLAMTARTLGGHLDATLRWQERPALHATWQEVALARVTLPEMIRELPLVGALSGELAAELDRVNPNRGDGSLTLDLSDVRLGPGTVQGIPLPEIFLGQGAVDIAASEGKLTIRRLEFEGGDLGLSLTGTVVLREELPRSLFSGVLSLQPNDQVARDLALLFALFPSEKGSDGRYTARVRGTLGAPRLLKR